VADLNFYANIAEILGTLTIIGGGVLAPVQLSSFAANAATRCPN
jgi:hypothetical protein